MPKGLRAMRVLVTTCTWDWYLIGGIIETSLITFYNSGFIQKIFPLLAVIKGKKDRLNKLFLPYNLLCYDQTIATKSFPVSYLI